MPFDHKAEPDCLRCSRMKGMPISLPLEIRPRSGEKNKDRLRFHDARTLYATGKEQELWSVPGRQQLLLFIQDNK
ncbi:MAG: hypothetical protein AUH96_11230 [Nitrospirae bacterium 13_2_20CM_2_61_4]|nr:MAG: hypothetical protein AUH96_11230 [Nitrospirae bacterium 13_2_20CM_2_61_4]